MNSKTVMICLEQLGIGGVETAVYNQAYTLKDKGYNVIVVARSEIYKQKLENYGIKCIDFEFALENKFDFEKAEMLENIMRENDVCEVYIHQFPCILSAFLACIKLKIPYVSYIHVGLLTEKDNVYDWFEKNFSIYKVAFKLFFENAYKIIAITEYAADYNSQRYNIDKKKYIVINNSINFDLYNQNNLKNNNDNNYLINGKFKAFLLITRISNEKLTSIKNAIDFYISYCDKTNIIDAQLNILGDGDKINEVKDYINKINKKQYSIIFLGKSNDVTKYIKQSDIVLGLGRCILEAIVLRKLAIIAAYNGSVVLVKPNNIDIASKNNFDGKNFNISFYDLLIEELIKLNNNTINDIVDNNYEYVYNNLNVKKNIYIINETKNFQENIDNYKSNLNCNFLYSIFDLENTNQKNIKLIYNMESKISDLNNSINQKENENNYFKSEIDELEIKNKELSKELSNIYNSKRWKYANKIAKIFKK